MTEFFSTLFDMLLGLASNILYIVFGFIIGSLLMWYYWRRYKTTDAFKQEVHQRVDDIKNKKYKK